MELDFLHIMVQESTLTNIRGTEDLAMDHLEKYCFFFSVGAKKDSLVYT